MRKEFNRYFAGFPDARELRIIGPMPFQMPCDFADFSGPALYIDGGARHQPEGLGLSVGDGDSSAKPLQVCLDPEKDISDLGCALQQIPLRFRDICLLGLLGGRLDHLLCNLGEAHDMLRKRTNCRLNFENTVLGFSQGCWQFQRPGLFSVCVMEQTRLTLTGDCKYQCQQPTHFAPFSSLGLSNEGYGTIYLDTPSPAFVFFIES